MLVKPDRNASKIFNAWRKNYEVIGSKFFKILSDLQHVSSIQVPDKCGKTGDVVTGFPNLKGYLTDDSFFGTIAGRYANRIAKGKFNLNGTEFTLETNNGPNALHGGSNGFDKRLWKYEKVSNEVSKFTSLEKRWCSFYKLAQPPEMSCED